MAKPATGDGRKPEDDDDGGHENRPTDLDEKSHRELMALHAQAASAILFAKNIQWRSVGSALLVFAAMIAIAVSTHADRKFIDVMSLISIFLTCGVIFVLVMYQFWQFNEISRVREIEKHFSSVYREISSIKSRREGNFHRYTLLTFMIVSVILGAVVANIGMSQGL
ncbi:MAG: hypothetical protein RIC16_05090 [Rhodospirillales bacterium]